VLFVARGQKIEIHIHQPTRSSAEMQYARTVALLELREAEHCRGEHTYGSMRRDCPLCCTRP
jgi:hypothetical protein